MAQSDSSSSLMALIRSAFVDGFVIAVITLIGTTISVWPVAGRRLVAGLGEGAAVPCGPDLL